MSSKKNYKEKILRKKEEKPEEPELPKYRDRAKERREDQNPDYEPTELGAFHAVAPPGAVDVRTADAQKISIENSKYLGGDLEHTHLVKGLDYALLHKVRSEIDKKPEADGEADGVSKGEKDSQLSFRTAMAKSVYQWIIKPQSNIKANEMFLPGRMAFIFNMEEGYSHDIPTTVHRSKADCPVPQEMVTVSVDGSVLDRIAKIMSYLRLGSSGKVLKKKKKEKGEIREKMSASAIGHEEDEDHKTQSVNGTLVSKADRAPPPQTAQQSHPDAGKKHQSVASRLQEDDIFVGDGVDYDVPSKEAGGSPLSEDMEESPHNRDRQAFLSQPAYGPLSAPETSQVWQQTNGYNVMQESALASGYQGEWQDYQYAEQFAYPAEYIQQPLQGYELQVDANMPLDPNFMTQEEKDRGLGSVFKRDDQRLQQLREKDSREKDPTFISESYSECYPGYQEYNHEIVDSDDDADLSKMDMGGRAKGRMHRWDFETEEEWATYNEQKEAMPKAAFQFGVKMQDGRKTRKQNKEHKFNNELHQINKLLAKKITEKGGTYEYDDETPSGKKLRI